MVTIGDRLHARRLALHLSQAEVAELVGCSREQVSQWETGHRQPAADRLASLAKALGCSADHILGLEAIVDPGAAQQATPVGPVEALIETLGEEERQAVPPVPAPPVTTGAHASLSDPGASLHDVLAFARAQGRTYIVHLGRAYRLRKHGWEEV